MANTLNETAGITLITFNGALGVWFLDASEVVRMVVRDE